jgi:LPS O-antigen subunit length determinant protein (WzzB/FepE family)
MSKENNEIQEDEIDLIALAKKIWEGRKTVIKITLIFMGIGLFVAIFSKKQYTASTTFVPQTSEGLKIGGNLSGLAAMAGINLGSIGGDAGISADLYPQIIESIAFRKELLQTPLTIEGLDKKVTLKEYYTNIDSPGVLGYIKKYTIGLPGLLIEAIKGKSENVIKSGGEDKNQLIFITKEEHKLIEKLENQFLLEINDTDNYLTVSASMPEPLAAAEFTKNIQDLLQQYIINFKVQKSKNQLKFVQDRYNETEEVFKQKQQQLARFRDRNQNTNSALAQTTLEQFQSEYDLAYSVYVELAKQLETQHIQVKEDTPVFTILNPVNVPVKKSQPKRTMILIIFTFLGGILSVCIILGKFFLSDLKRKWNNIE